MSWLSTIGDAVGRAYNAVKDGIKWVLGWLTGSAADENIRQIKTRIRRIKQSAWEKGLR